VSNEHGAVLLECGVCLHIWAAVAYPAEKSSAELQHAVTNNDKCPQCGAKTILYGSMNF
jgi:hypothetical protein